MQASTQYVPTALPDPIHPDPSLHPAPSQPAKNPPQTPSIQPASIHLAKHLSIRLSKSTHLTAQSPIYPNTLLSSHAPSPDPLHPSI